MPYLAVNKDGTEKIYDYEIERLVGLGKSDTDQLISYENLGKSDFWTMKNTKGYDFPKCGIFDVSIELPKGSIKKLTGIDLTWDDEPIKI
jgi:hypothetical protein